MRVAFDIGGTFTDCVVLDNEGTVQVGKALSTPEDFSNGALNAVADAAKNLGLGNEVELLAATKMFFHACTVADNTLITRSGPKTGLITTKGFGDTILLMRGRTTEGLTETEAFRASTQSKPEPIVAQPYIEELTERIDYKDSVLSKLFEEHVGSEKKIAQRYYLSREQIREMALHGMHFGGHSYSHPWFDWIDSDSLNAEIGASAEWLRQIEPGPWAFAYPYGGLNPDAPKIFRAHGFMAAFTTQTQINHTDPYFIGRLDGEEVARARHENG